MRKHGLPDTAGWVPGCVVRRSPNFDARPGGTLPTLLVLHAISLPPGCFDGEAVSDFFMNRLDAAAHPYFSRIATLRVSSHFLVRRDGEAIQFVSCLQRAWHAGVSQWKGRSRCNDHSIGIEVEGDDDLCFADAQYEALGELVTTLYEAYPLHDTVGHADIAPGRKTDPGPRFDWRRVVASRRT